MPIGSLRRSEAHLGLTIVPTRHVDHLSSPINGGSQVTGSDTGVADDQLRRPHSRGLLSASEALEGIGETRWSFSPSLERKPTVEVVHSVVIAGVGSWFRTHDLIESADVLWLQLRT